MSHSYPLSALLFVLALAGCEAHIRDQSGGSKPSDDFEDVIGYIVRTRLSEIRTEGSVPAIHLRASAESIVVNSEDARLNVFGLSKSDASSLTSDSNLRGQLIHSQPLGDADSVDVQINTSGSVEVLVLSLSDQSPEESILSVDFRSSARGLRTLVVEPQTGLALPLTTAGLPFDTCKTKGTFGLLDVDADSVLAAFPETNENDWTALLRYLDAENREESTLSAGLSTDILNQRNQYLLYLNTIADYLDVDGNGQYERNDLDFLRAYRDLGANENILDSVVPSTNAIRTSESALESFLAEIYAAEISCH